MKSVLKLLCLVAVVGFVSSTVLAARNNAGTTKPDALHGKVLRVDGANLVVNVKESKEAVPTPVSIATDDKTVITLDGAAAKLADLKEGMRVNVTPKTGTATNIEASTKKHKKD